MPIAKYLQTFLYIFRSSLLNLNYYREVLFVKFSFSFKYFLGLLYLANLALIIPILIGLLTLVPGLPQWGDRAKNSLVDAFPRDLVVTIQKGEVSVNKTEPYFYDAPSEITGGKHLFVIDTASVPGDYPKFGTVFLVTKNSLVMPDSVSSLSDFQDAVLDYPTYLQVIKGILPIFDHIVLVFWALFITLLLFGPPIGTVLTLPFKLIHLLVFTTILLLVTRLLNLSFKFSQLYKLAMHASTLPVVFFTFLGLFSLNPTIPFGYTLLLLIFLCAVLLRLRRVKS